MLLYADEDFALPVVVELRQQGHDVMTVQTDGRTGAVDADVLARTHEMTRVLITFNRRHFERLHRQGFPHSGIITCTRDSDFSALASRIDGVLAGLTAGRWCLRVNRLP